MKKGGSKIAFWSDMKRINAYMKKHTSDEEFIINSARDWANVFCNLGPLKIKDTCVDFALYLIIYNDDFKAYSETLSAYDDSNEYLCALADEILQECVSCKICTT